jgi:hypothetical protein
MAFCTQCGAEIHGAFCNRCGARAGQAAAGGTAAAPAAAPAKRKTSPLVWVLIVLLGFFGLGAVAVIGTGAFFIHKVKQAGVTPELWRTNPGEAVGKVLAAVNPNLEVVRVNDSDRRVILRDRHSGKQFSISIDAARNGSLTLEGDDEHGGGRVELGAGAKIPSWVPQYPGSHPETKFTAEGESDRDAGEAGNFSFRTIDTVSKVARFYEGEAEKMGLSVRIGPLGTVVIGEKDHDRYLKVVAVAGSDETSVNVTYARKR